MANTVFPKVGHDWLKHELDRFLHRRAGVIASGSGKVGSGTVLGKIVAGTATAAAGGGNTGNATIAMHGTPLATGVRPGVYTITVIEPASDAGAFVVADPDGVEIGSGVIGTLFAGPIRFTITDGATDAVAGDRFTVTVAAGTGKFVPIDFDAVNGAEVAAAIVIEGVDATSADAETAVLTGHAQIVTSQLTWPDGTTTNQKNAAIAQLEKLGIVDFQRY